MPMDLNELEQIIEEVAPDAINNIYEELNVEEHDDQIVNMQYEGILRIIVSKILKRLS